MVAGDEDEMLALARSGVALVNERSREAGFAEANGKDDDEQGIEDRSFHGATILSQSGAREQVRSSDRPWEMPCAPTVGPLTRKLAEAQHVPPMPTVDPKASAKIDAFIAKLPEDGFARPICEKLRKVVAKASPDMQEDWKWRSPVFHYQGHVCGFMAFKKWVNFYLFKGQLIDDPKGILTHGEGNSSSRSVRFTDAKEIVEKDILPLIKKGIQLNREGVKPAPKKKPALRVPADVRKAINANAKAKKVFDGFTPSCKREYVEWIVEAKREETRQRRIDKMISQLQEGLRLHDKYRNC